MTYTRLQPENPDVENFRGVFYKMRRALGTTGFGLNELRMPPGFEGVEHDKSDTGHEEVYVALEGGGTFTIDGEDVPFEAGDYLDDTQGRRRCRRSALHRRRRAAKPAYDGRESL